MYHFKVGDRVKAVRKTTSPEYWPTFCARVPSRTGYIHDIDSNGILYLDKARWAFLPSDLVPATSAKPPKFLLRYELDTDPVEEFSTLPEVKSRIKELLSNPSLKRDSIKVYELKSVLDVQIQDLIVMKPVTIKSPAPAKKRAKSKTKTTNH